MLKKLLLIMVLLSLSNICYSQDFLASVGKSTSDIVVERKNEIMWEKEMNWVKYKHDKHHEYKMKKAENK